MGAEQPIISSEHAVAGQGFKSILIIMRVGSEPENTGGVVCHYTPEYFVLEQRYHLQSAEYLRVDRHSGEMKIVHEAGVGEQRKFSAFLGVMDLDGEKFLLFCDEAKIVSAMDNLEVFEVSSLFFLGYTDERVLKRRP